MSHSDTLFEVPATAADPFEAADSASSAAFQSRATRSGADFKEFALTWIERAGGVVQQRSIDLAGFPVDAVMAGPNGREFAVLLRGTPQESRSSGLRRPDTVEKVGFMAIQLARHQPRPVLIVTSDLPDPQTKTGFYLASLSPDVWDVAATRGDLRGFKRFEQSLADDVASDPPAAAWRHSGRSPDVSLPGLGR